MQRRLLVVAVTAACASALAAGAFASEPWGTPRHLKLESGAHEGAIRFLAGTVSLDGDKPSSWVTVTRTGTFTDPRYGTFEISREMLLAMKENFAKGVFGQDVMIDVAHRPDQGAAGKIVELMVDANKLRARVEWTPYGVDAIKNRGYQYLSAEYHEEWQDNEKRIKHGCVLLGAGLTIRPVVKHLDPVQLSEDYTGESPTLIALDLQSQLLQEHQTMFKELIDALRKKLAALQIGDAAVTAIVTLAEQSVGKVTDKAVAEILVGAFEASGKQLAEQIAAAAGKDVKITLSIPENLKAGLSEAQVKELMEKVEKERSAAAKTLADTLAGRQKLLADTINAATGIPEAERVELIDAVKDLVTADTSEDVVRRLAATQVAAGNKLIAARQLSSMGFPHPHGSVHIQVVGSSEITALQAEVDKRIYGSMPAHQRYMLSEGKPIESNKALVEKVLSMYDAQNGRRLVEEYKQMKRLAAGDSVVSDVAVPASFERTVIREALYQLVGLGLCDVGTDNFAAVTQLPYSFRDTAAAGRANVRKYEGQAVARAAVKQALEEARPIPQKIAFEVSDELRYLIGNGQINFDIVAENARNASRIIGEDTELLVFDEHLRASDEQATAAIANEAVATGDGAKTIFILNQFPVVRPRKVFDLQGNQVGATLYPITVSTNAVNRSEYDGTGLQAPGVYWKIDYNLGELTFVNELGVATPVTATHAIVASYTYTTNVFKWDSDLGALKIDEKYDDFLYRFGLRKATVEDRAYMANMAIMSGTLRTQIEQARQFGANFKRSGTDLMADGNLGRIKDVPGFRSYAPGLAIGDNRTVLCERGTVRFRMLKPWTMGQLENQKDANGRFTGKKEAYGDQFIVVHTPSELRKAFTSMVIYSAAARVDR